MKLHAFFLLIGGLAAYGQACPSSSHLQAMSGSPSPASWQIDSTLNLYIVSNDTSGVFSSDQLSAFQTAFNNWSALSGSNLGYTQTITDTFPTSPTEPYIVMQYGSSFNGLCPSSDRACTFTHWVGYPDSPAYVNYATITVAPGALDNSAIATQVLAHEIGHSYAIADCSAADCLANVTVMDPTITDRSHTGPVCCDRKFLYSMTGGSYGQSGECMPTKIQGTAFLDTTWDHNSVNATFQVSPSPGNTMVAGCMGISASRDEGFTIKDNQNDGANTNSYSQLIYQTNLFYAPVALFKADSIISTSSPFTVTCATVNPNASDAINLFVLEYSDLAVTGSADATAGVGGDDLSCSTSLTTTTADDLIIALYNNFSTDNPAD